MRCKAYLHCHDHYRYGVAFHLAGKLGLPGLGVLSFGFCGLQGELQVRKLPDLIAHLDLHKA